jgi:hypothetical protein
MTFNLNGFDAHANGILAQLAKTFRLSNSSRSAVLTQPEECFVISSMNGVLNRRDIDVAVQSFAFTNAARGPQSTQIPLLVGLQSTGSSTGRNTCSEACDNRTGT